MQPEEQESQPKEIKPKDPRQNDQTEVKFCGFVTLTDIDAFIRQGMTREEARKAALKAKMKTKK